MTDSRSLFDCANARVHEKRVYCRAGKKLPTTVAYWAVAAGRALRCNVCRHCVYYEPMGPPLPDIEKGWRRG